MWAAFGRGERVDLRVGESGRDDPANSAAWTPGRTIRAEALTALLLSERPPPSGQVPALRLAGARIEGFLDLYYAYLPYGLLFNACDFPDGLGLYDTRTRHLSVHDCRLARLNAANAVVDGNLRLSGSVLTGPLILDGVHVAGFLSLDGARLANPNGPALAADRIQVNDHLWMREGFTARGEVVLRGARIGGDLDLRGAEFSNPGGTALAASGMKIDGALMCQELRADGQVRIGGCTVTGHIHLEGAHLAHSGHTALAAHHLQAGASAYLTDGFTARGGVDLARARVEGTLSLNGGRLTGTSGYALSLGHAQLAELDLCTAESPQGGVFLNHATVGVLHDDAGTWPTPLSLDGLRYTRIQNPLPAAKRIPWLCRDAQGYTPQPFEQLAAAYRTMGQEEQARTVLLAKQRHRHSTLPWYARAWGAVQDATVGYGYRPMRAVIWLLALLTAGSTVFSIRRPIRTASVGPSAYNPVIFTLDHLLPVIDFGQGAAYTPTPDTQWVGYALTAAGWILATTIATGLTRSVNRP